VLGGLGKLGFRIATMLGDLRIPTVIIDKLPDNRFADAVPDEMPLLAGDIRLDENLGRARISDASCLIAVTPDDLANVEACLHAKKRNESIRTIARVFDDYLASRADQMLEITKAKAAVSLASPAFVDGAVDKYALRPFEMNAEPLIVDGGEQLVGLRYEAKADVDGRRIEEWVAAGARMVAFRRSGNGSRGPNEFVAPLRAGDSAVLVGPEGIITRLASTMADEDKSVVRLEKTQADEPVG
jgi:Trk K+ transport system NAD-binding subunit